MYNINSYEYTSYDRIVVIGDIHGDLKRFKNILINAKIINNNLEWIAVPSNTIVIQMGDQIDSLNRSNEIKEWEKIKDIEMLYFTNSLDNLAKIRGGRLLSLIGNHELMNILGNFSYVSDNSNYMNRHNGFKPNGELSNILANRPLVVKINDLLFCHAGIKRNHIDILLKYNKDISYINELWNKFVLLNKVKIEDKEIFDNIILDSSDGILWTRDINENELEYVLNNNKCSYMFIGHNTVDKVTLYKNKLWLTDTGISRAYGKENYQYIDISNNNISIKEINDNI
tara:strand:+ start:113 stop:967 length:855 start_codon:yes stop_codon:yes gene_type:complete